MIKYSLLDIPSITDEVVVENVTIRIEEGIFDKTIITYDPIKLAEDGARISYGLIIKMLLLKGQSQSEHNTIRDILSTEELNILYTIADDIFIDVLQLLKNNITFGA